MKGTEAFQAFRGAYPFRAEFCAPAKAWEKGSVETGVKYGRNLVFRPRLAVERWAVLNAAIITELEADLPTRQLDDGCPVEEALAEERRRLRAMPAHLPATCRVVARVADKFGHVRVDRVTYSAPIRHAYRPVWAKLYHDRVGSSAAGRSSMRFTCCRCSNPPYRPWRERRRWGAGGDRHASFQRSRLLPLRANIAGCGCVITHTSRGT